ncbi:vWA domain-containing protein [Georgenia sp. Z1491]|uniref:vWA domain-containing protein n=1 Tax=Georgenia sp. Z1491 TaxID=3416707 RepID=UPI003CE783FC
MTRTATDTLRRPDPPAGTTTSGREVETLCAEFAEVLRGHGVRIGTSQVLTLVQALHALGGVRAGELFWAGRAILVQDPRHYDAYARAFAEFFAGAVPGEDLPVVARPPTSLLVEAPDGQGQPPSDGSVEEEYREQPEPARVVASAEERLRVKSFTAMTDEERREAARMIRDLRLRLRHRLSRRRRPARSGRHLDMRGTMRSLLATDGEPLRLRRLRRRTRQRPITFLVDVSGSMSAYGRTILRFAHMLMRAGERIEVFTIGVRPHRVTADMRTPSPDRALERVGAAVTDWDGGTRLASSISTLLRGGRGQDALRGAVVVVCSDGLDHDEPAVMAASIARLQRLAHELVWLNPLKADPRYEPLARGMAAALPHIDDFRAGHSIAGLEALAPVLAGRGRSGRLR